MLKPKIWKVGLLAVWSALLTALTFVFGGVALRALRVYGGENVYWLTSLFITGLFLLIGWEIYAVAYFGMVLLVGVFSDLEERGQGYFVSGAAGLLILSLIGGGMFAFWRSHQGPGWFESLVLKIEEPIQQVFALQQNFPIEISDVLIQAPSFLLMIYALSLFFALLLERRILRSLGVKPPVERKLQNFRVPDLTIWVLIPSVLGTFGQVEDPMIHALSVNVFNICMLLYFLQGMAVISVLFVSLKMSLFWQTALMIFLAIQLFAVVSLVGVADFWMDFRRKIRSKPAQMKKEFFRNK